MVQGRAAGNGNFDIDAITRLMNADANAPALIEQPFVDRELAELEAEAAELETDLQNPSSNRVDEAQAFMQRTGAAKLNVSGLQAGITIQESRNEFSGGARGSDRVWEERKDREDRDRREQSRVADIADDLQNAEERRQAEVERQQCADVWNNSDHTYAGQRMSADEWLRMIQWFKQPENRAAWEDAMMAETHQTREQVRATGGKIDRLNELIEKESRGETLSREEIAERDRLNRDRDVQTGMRIARERANLAQGVDPVVENRVEAQAAATSANEVDTNSYADAGANLLSGGNATSTNLPTRTSVTAQIEGRGEFAVTAPSLRTNFVAANVATAPLDQPPEPSVIASAAPAVAPLASASAGLDV